MKFKAKNEEEAEEIMKGLDELAKVLAKRAKIEKDIPGLEEYLNEELLELHYCRKGTRMHISVPDEKTKMIMVSDVIGHLLSEIPEEKRNDVLLMAINAATFDDLAQ